MENKQINEKENRPVTVPYVVYCDTVSNDQWVIKKLIIALVVVVVLMFASNLAWLYVFQQYDYSTEETITTVDSEGEGVANYTGHDGGVTFGKSDSSEDSPDANPA